MPLTRDSIKTNIYQIGAPAPVNFVTVLRGEHEVLTPTPPTAATATPRISCTWTPDTGNPKVHVLTAVADNNGDTYYLPYDNNKISSMRLPDPPPAGVRYFMTANMSGCKFYVDTITGSADLMVYHANARDTSPAPNHSPADFQAGAADTELDRLHTAAQADYGAAPYHFALVNAASLAKPQYYGRGALAEQRKAASRTLLAAGPGGYAAPLLALNPEFWGGCSVIGFYKGGWRLYYQTWGAVEYERPTIEGRKATAKAVVTFHWNHLHKLSKEGNRHALDIRYAKVVDQRRFYP